MKKGATLVGALVAIAILSITFIALFNLQVGIIRANVDKQYDNTANLLLPEGLEIVRAIYQSNLNDTGTWNEGLADGTYAVDYKTTDIKAGLSVTSDCDTAALNNSCSLVQIAGEGYTLGNGNRLYRYITVSNATDKITVTSTVIVRNIGLNRNKVYKADMEFFNTVPPTVQNPTAKSCPAALATWYNAAGTVRCDKNYDELPEGSSTNLPYYQDSGNWIYSGKVTVTCTNGKPVQSNNICNAFQPSGGGTTEPPSGGGTTEPPSGGGSASGGCSCYENQTTYNGNTNHWTCGGRSDGKPSTWTCSGDGAMSGQIGTDSYRGICNRGNLRVLSYGISGGITSFSCSDAPASTIAPSPSGGCACQLYPTGYTCGGGTDGLPSTWRCGGDGAMTGAQGTSSYRGICLRGTRQDIDPLSFRCN